METLKINETVLQQARLYAEKNRLNLSVLVETFLKNLYKKDSEETQITPRVKKISGVLSSPPADFDYVKEYETYLAEKYSKE